MSAGSLETFISWYLLTTPKPLPYTNYWANYLEDSAEKTSLLIKVIPIGIESVSKYFNALNVRYIISALAKFALISSTSLS